MGVASSATAAVAALISKQSNKKSGGGGRRMGGGGGGGGGGRSYGGGVGGGRSGTFRNRGGGNYGWGGDDFQDDFNPMGNFDIIGGGGAARAVPAAARAVPAVSSSQPARPPPPPVAKPKVQQVAPAVPAARATVGGSRVFGPRVRELLANRPHGCFRKMVEKMYEKKWGEGLPGGWLEEMEGAGVRVERVTEANPVCTLVEGQEGQEGQEGGGWPVGSCCVARWADDGVWYRARVEARAPAGTYTVTFLDYGNQAEVAEAAMVAHRGKVPKAEVEMIDEFVLEAKEQEQEVVRKAASGKDGPNWEEVGRRVVRVVEVRGAAEHRAVEAAYLGEHGEAPPEGWAWRLQLQGRVRVEEGLYSLPLPPSEVVGSSGGGGKCEELGAWEEWEVRVCRVWREEATILLTIQRADLPAYPALQQAMARYYGQQGNRVEEEAVEGALVAVCRGGWWYRGRVVGRGEGRAVRLVDTGEEAPAVALQPLWRQFGQLPAAAVQTELGGVALVKGKRTAAVEWVQGQVAGARLAAQARWTEAGHLALTLSLGEVGDLATQMVSKGLAKATYIN